MIKYIFFIHLVCLQAFVMLGAEQNSIENKDPFMFEVSDIRAIGGMNSIQIKPVKDQGIVNSSIAINISLYRSGNGSRYDPVKSSMDISIHDEDDNYFCGIPVSKVFLTINPSISDLTYSEATLNSSIFEDIVKPIFQGNFIISEKDFSVKQENAYRIEEYKALQKRIEATYYALSVKLLRAKIIKNIVMDPFFTHTRYDIRTSMINSCDYHIKILQNKLAKISAEESIFSKKQELILSSFLKNHLSLEQFITSFKALCEKKDQ